MTGLKIIHAEPAENKHAPETPDSSTKSFDVMSPVDISKLENIADIYAATKEYSEQIAKLEEYVRELNKHNILIKRGFNGYEISTDSVPETLLPKTLVPRLQHSLNKLYTNSYVVSRALRDVPVDQRRDITRATNLKKEQVSTQLETAILNNLLYSDKQHSNTVFSTVPSLDMPGRSTGAEVQLNDIEAAIKRKEHPTTHEQQVVKAIEGVRAFGQESQKDQDFSKERTVLIDQKKSDMSKILSEYRIALDSKNVSLDTHKNLGKFTQNLANAWGIEPHKLDGRTVPQQLLQASETLAYRTVNNGLNHFSMLADNPFKVFAILVSLISLILPDSIKNSTPMKWLRKFTLWDGVVTLATDGKQGVFGALKGTANAFLDQAKGLADTTKPIDHDAVESLDKHIPLHHFEKILSLNEAENKLADIVFNNITVGNIISNTTLDETTHDISINKNTLFTPAEQERLKKWPKFQADTVYKKMLTAVYDNNTGKITEMTKGKHLGKPPLGYTKEYLAMTYLKEQYKYPMDGSKYEGNVHSTTTSFTRVFEYELIKTSEDENKKNMEAEYAKYLATEKKLA